MAERSVRGSVVKALAAEATRRKREADDTDTPAAEEGPRRGRPRRACRDAPVQTLASAGPAAAAAAARSLPLTGKLLVVHANKKTYGKGGDAAATGDDHRLVAAKRSNREDFDFKAKDYLAMRDGGVYSGDPRVNKLLPLPRPTYTEFINRAQRAKALDRLDFVYCPPDAPRLPRLINYRAYERVVYAGVSFRRFAKIWQPERHHFFKPRALPRLFPRHRADNASRLTSTSAQSFKRESWPCSWRATARGAPAPRSASSRTCSSTTSWPLRPPKRTRGATTTTTSPR